MWCDKCFSNLNIIIFEQQTFMWSYHEISQNFLFIISLFCLDFLLLSLSLTHFKGEEGDDEEEEDDPDYDPSKDKAAKGQQPPECKQQWPSG